MSAASPVRPSPRRRRIAAGLATVLAAGTMAGTVTGPAHAENSGNSESSGAGPGDVTMVQANIKTAKNTFEADVDRVMAEDPDFISYNEVSYRQGTKLAPEGYSLHRSVRNRYTAATPVAWKHPKWTKVEAGTFRISGVRKVPDGKKTKLGLRFANWATLRSEEGRVLSIVSVHVSPTFKLDGKKVDLIRPSVRRLGKLVGQLAPAGPVLVGGDFNVHYKSRRYPRDLFKKAGLVPTYDTMGNYFATGDHQGATIDYLFNRGAGELETVRHGRKELASDHDAVIGGFDWKVDAAEETTRIVSNPDGTAAERWAAIGAMADRIRSTNPGQSVDVLTGRLSQRNLFRALRNAVTRGVHVRVTTRSKRLSTLEKRFRRHAEDYAKSRLTRCRSACKDRWRASDMRRTFGLVRNEDRRPTLRLDVNRSLNKWLPERRTKLFLKTGDNALAEGAQMLAHVR